uniref:Uncharacterized protein n=2 Tax=Clastoptera arizonana TaxID=38151 RepID=A0A1B6C3U6_9HEMI
MLHNIDDISGYSAIRVGDLKYVKGTTLYGYLDNWTGKIRQPKEIPIPMYNISAVLNSEVSMAFKSTGQVLTSDTGIQVLREQTRVMCKEHKKETGKMYPKCSPLKKPCVFNIRKDPCEMRNLFEELKDTGVVKDLENRLHRLRRTMKPANNQRTDLRANPRLYNNTWVSWDDYDSPTTANSVLINSHSPLLL